MGLQASTTHSQPDQSYSSLYPGTAAPGTPNSAQKAQTKPLVKRARYGLLKGVQDQYPSDDPTSNIEPHNGKAPSIGGPAMKGASGKNSSGSTGKETEPDRKGVRDREIDGDQEGDGDDDGNNEPADSEVKDVFAIPPTQFKKFRKLPLEIRRMVWDLALPEPQVIKITANGYLCHLTRGGITTQTWINRPRAHYRVPYMLGVCKESRREVLVFHRPCFRANFGGIPIYFNAKQDLLYFQSTDALINFYGGSLPNYVREDLTHGYRLNMRDMHTVVEQIAIGRVRNMEGMIGGVLNQMRALKSVVIEDLSMRPDGENVIMDFTQGIADLALGWKDYTVRRQPQRGVDFKFTDRPGFEALINQWAGRIFAEDLTPEARAVIFGGCSSSVNGSGAVTNSNTAATAGVQAPLQAAAQ
ncbi:hypothetical protein BUE80_DR007109 [Diplocarpon rosae]|nr:hypothetical protein BUE80_DR007109 [Diplocarpon rosae]